MCVSSSCCFYRFLVGGTDDWLYWSLRETRFNVFYGDKINRHLIFCFGNTTNDAAKSIKTSNSSKFSCYQIVACQSRRIAYPFSFSIISRTRSVRRNKKVKIFSKKFHHHFILHAHTFYWFSIGITNKSCTERHLTPVHCRRCGYAIKKKITRTRVLQMPYTYVTNSTRLRVFNATKTVLRQTRIRGTQNVVLNVAVEHIECVSARARTI